LVALTNAVAVPHGKTVHSHKFNHTVKQTKPPFQWASSNCKYVLSLVQVVTSSHYCIVFCSCGWARTNWWCTISALLFYLTDILGTVVYGQDHHRFILLPQATAKHPLVQNMNSLCSIWSFLLRIYGSPFLLAPIVPMPKRPVPSCFLELI
jgi:protein tyrosine phosphatase